MALTNRPDRNEKRDAPDFRGAPPVVTTISLADLYQVFENAAHIGVSAYLRDRLQLVAVQGTVASSGTEYGPRLYEVALEYAGFTVYLDVLKQRFAELRVDVGDFVEVKGRPVVLPSRGKFRAVRLRLDVYDIRHAEAPAEIVRRKAQTLTLERVRALSTGRSAFPLKYRISLALICAHNSQVEADFLYPIAALRGRVKVSILRTRMDDAASIVRALQGAHADIVALVRGGGDDEDFAVFDDSAVLEAYASVQGYRLLGVGHSKHMTLLDLIVDYAATTPSAAGQFVATQLGPVASLVEGAQNEVRSGFEARLAELQQEMQQEQALARTYQVKLRRSELMTFAAAVAVLVLLAARAVR